MKKENIQSEDTYIKIRDEQIEDAVWKYTVELGKKGEVEDANILYAVWKVLRKLGALTYDIGYEEARKTYQK